MTKKLAILGATGSVGSQAVDVARSRGYSVELISAHKNARAAEALARELKPRAIVMTDSTAAGEVRAALTDTDIKIYSGMDALCSLIEDGSHDTVINSIMGSAGLLPTLAALRSGKRLALANKESLVTAGEIVMAEQRRCGAELIPVDSEHSAIFQSLKSGAPCEIKRIILTASGGPFYGYTREMLTRVTPQLALAHPTWKMGKRITVDSATLMNKGFEVIEAAHLFSVSPEKIETVIHRESILHSAVEYIDNSIIAQLSVPDMRMCVQYAVDYPERMEATSAQLDLFSVGALSFAAPDREAFPLLDLAYRVAGKGGALPAVLNAADEVATDAFLHSQISFDGIFEVISSTLDKHERAEKEHSLDAILTLDKLARETAKHAVKAFST